MSDEKDVDICSLHDILEAKISRESNLQLLRYLSCGNEKKCQRTMSRASLGAIGPKKVVSSG